ncbi:PAS domain S-box protein [Ramlibacter albus]|uniref:histidine kinase n=1 Tax=Ramlibacter albus TaxID=2079448 RepID=A0A923S475_9BURK|nr:PAS domain S-box protein [Ramlibacter albus]MBC5763837.1 PAS domain S-box protein [Ramlibacter albus]
MAEPDDGIAQLAQAIEEMLWVWDAATSRVVYTNPAFERFWHTSAAQLGPGADVLLDRIVPEDAPTLRRLRNGLPLAGYVEEYRVKLPPARGERAWRNARLRERAFATKGPNGETRVTHVARDISWQVDTSAQLREEISRRTDAERSLSDATARLEALIATANDPVITIDEQGHVIDWNQAAERVFGWARYEAVGKLLTELIIPPVHRKWHEAGIQRFLQDGSSQIFQRRVETRALKRSGEEFDVELSVWPVRTAQGYTFSSFVRDISRRKAQARALAESEAKYRKVVENVNEGILITAGGRILYANPKALEQTGQDLETAKSKPFIEFIHPDDRERVLGNHLKRLRGEPVENHYQFRVIHSGGSVRWLEISGVLFEWQGQPATLNFLMDVTERRQVEQDMRNALARERELSQLKSRFVAVASHEFRTPLAAILSSVELLDDYGARLPTHERKEIVQQIRSAVTRMNGMVENILLTSKLEAGRLAFDPLPRSVPDLLVQVAAEMDQANPQASRIEMRCDGLDEPRLMDVKLVRHILVNLLGNALKYSPPDTVVECYVATEHDDDRLVFSVQDRGIGIPKDDLPRLFETFHRGGNVGNIQGTGIGLNIVKECVELHQGTIEVESEPGHGTIFHVRLPAPVVAPASAQ